MLFTVTLILWNFQGSVGENYFQSTFFVSCARGSLDDLAKITRPELRRIKSFSAGDLTDLEYGDDYTSANTRSNTLTSRMGENRNSRPTELDLSSMSFNRLGPRPLKSISSEGSFSTAEIRRGTRVQDSRRRGRNTLNSDIASVDSDSVARSEVSRETGSSSRISPASSYMVPSTSVSGRSHVS
ncbi:uncharacterized protein DEA37_0015117 [Paragonimus westermani]|uniref:Uncharacterized protein n=1 Tax=Paragonimus westermani TaxID=34504 RepID=A0A5J4NI81_9TREM|nr:uncharacterized protein DEA37_0015117 [Paragonimus westermani]